MRKFFFAFLNFQRFNGVSVHPIPNAPQSCNHATRNRDPDRAWILFFSLRHTWFQPRFSANQQVRGIRGALEQQGAALRANLRYKVHPRGTRPVNTPPIGRRFEKAFSISKIPLNKFSVDGLGRQKPLEKI
jgi:hypothetical protein